MYIFELFSKIFKGKTYKSNITYDPNRKFEEIAIEDCNHVFMPLDISNEYFACKYCGLVVDKNNLDNKTISINNPFEYK